MDYRNELENLGLNVAEGIDRVMGDEDFYETMLGIFVDTVNENPISLEDFTEDNVDNMASQVHMMKGMCGNLSITPLFDSYMEALGLLRGGKPKEARAVMEKLLPIQEKIVACINEHR